MFKKVRIKYNIGDKEKIFDQGVDAEGNERPRVRTASSQSHLNRIMRDEGLNQFRFNVVFQ